MSLVLEVVGGSDNSAPPLRLEVGPGQSAIIGRGIESDLYLPCTDKAVSRKHGEIISQDGAYYLLDHSANGIFVNQASAAIGGGGRYRLNNGDLLEMGAFTLKVSITSLVTEDAMHSQTNSINQPVSAISQANSSWQASSGAVAPFVTPQLPLVEELDFAEPPATIAFAEPRHAKLTNDFGDLEDNFAPPSMTIPVDWDSEPSAIADVEAAALAPKTEPQLEPQPEAQSEPKPESKPSLESKSELGQTKAPVVPFASKNTKLVEALLKGLGCDQISSDQIDSKVLFAVGKLLRLSLDGHFDMRGNIHLAKSKLSFDKISIARQKESDPLGDFESVDEFISSFVGSGGLAPEVATRRFARTVEYNCEDVEEIVGGHQIVIDRFLKALSPDAVTAALDKSQKSLGKSDFSPTTFNDGFTSSSRKWAFFLRNWKKLFARANVAVKKEYEAKFLMAHARRMGARDEAK